jgi:hypothetical protein
LEEGKMVANAQALAPGTLTKTQQKTGTEGKKTNWTPTAKVSVGILAASVTTLLLPLWKHFTNYDLQAAEATAVTTLITFGIQYLTPDNRT